MNCPYRWFHTLIQQRHFSVMGAIIVSIDSYGTIGSGDRGLGFFSGMLALNYFSRLADPISVWSVISVVLLLLVWGLGRGNWRISLAAIICTIVGAIIPIYGFSIGSRGIVLSVAGLLSILWLAARNWYGWYQLEPRAEMLRDRVPDSEGIFTRHDLLEESAKYNQLNPGTQKKEEIDRRRLRDEGVTNE